MAAAASGEATSAAAAAPSGEEDHQAPHSPLLSPKLRPCPSRSKASFPLLFSRLSSVLCLFHMFDEPRQRSLLVSHVSKLVSMSQG
uniref:Uncharacterized protein n=1 Tax=Arundo donax TaxID=35708 RepID=A0A0A9DKY1_ARUDO